MIADIQLVEELLEVWQEIHDFQKKHSHLAAECGAMAVFVGTMRDHNEGDTVRSMFLDHYSKMTQSYLEEMVAQVQQQYDLGAVLLRHRVGDLQPGDSIVLVATWAAHRKAAYESNRLIMEELKSHAPFWKREELEDGSHRWVKNNTPG